MLGGGSPHNPPTDVATPKPRIWSLADMATSGSALGSASGLASGHLPGLSAGAGKMLGGGLARGLHHLEGSPYSRPLFPPVSLPYPYLPPESLLAYSGRLGFPSLAEMPPSLLAPNPLMSDLSRDLLRRGPEITRPEALRPADLHPADLARPELARPEPQRPDLKEKEV